MWKMRVIFLYGSFGGYMPAKKLSALTNRHETKEEKSLREEGEKAKTPKTLLSSNPPKMISSNKTAAATWARLIGLYSEVEGTITTAFDQDLLIKYCLLEDECIKMAGLRDAILKDYNTVANQMSKLKPKGEEIKQYFKCLEQVNALLARYQGMDARLDGKRKLLHSLAQSLYLTPRSRAGVSPTNKKPEEPVDPIEELL
jgi:phage terminase small subunit